MRYCRTAVVSHTIHCFVVGFASSNMRSSSDCHFQKTSSRQHSVRSRFFSLCNEVNTWLCHTLALCFYSLSWLMTSFCSSPEHMRLWFRLSREAASGTVLSSSVGSPAFSIALPHLLGRLAEQDSNPWADGSDSLQSHLSWAWREIKNIHYMFVVVIGMRINYNQLYIFY